VLNWFAMFGTAGTPPKSSSASTAREYCAQGSAIADKLLPQASPKPMKVAEFAQAFSGSRTHEIRKIVEQANIKLSN
jgi:hypothetical protein